MDYSLRSRLAANNIYYLVIVGREDHQIILKSTLYDPNDMYQRDFENSVVLKYCLVGVEGRSFEENVYNNSLISYNIILYKRFDILNNGLWTTTAFTSHNCNNNEYSTCV